MKDNLVAPGNIGNLDVGLSFLTSGEFRLSLIVLGLGLTVLLAQYLLLRRIASTPNDIMKVFVLSFIVIGALLSITAGFSADSVAPIMGLFGTIAGYLLGRRESDEAKPNV